MHCSSCYTWPLFFPTLWLCTALNSCYCQLLLFCLDIFVVYAWAGTPSKRRADVVSRLLLPSFHCRRVRSSVRASLLLHLVRSPALLFALLFVVIVVVTVSTHQSHLLSFRLLITSFLQLYSLLHVAEPSLRPDDRIANAGTSHCWRWH